MAVVQPAGGGRRRLYCTNAHRAEARRRRLADSPEAAPGEFLGPILERLASVLNDLRGHEATLRSIDPARQAMETAQLRAESTAEVLAAQQAAARAAEEAARISEQLSAERADWDRERAGYQSQIEELRASTSSAVVALDEARAAHRAELDERDQRAARSAAADEEEAGRLARELDLADTEAAASRARADAADHRASSAEDEARKAAERARGLEAEIISLRAHTAQTQSAMETASVRAEAAERLLEDSRAELQASRERHDGSLSQLHEQVAQLIARTPAPRPAGKIGAKKAPVPTA